MPIERALEIATSYDLDLVEVAPNAKPPVCKVLDFGKYMYEKKKKENEAKKKQQIEAFSSFASLGFFGDNLRFPPFRSSLVGEGPQGEERKQGWFLRREGGVFYIR